MQTLFLTGECQATDAEEMTATNPYFAFVMGTTDLGSIADVS